jgi:hypothetical protein
MVGKSATESEDHFFTEAVCFGQVMLQFEPFIAGDHRVYLVKTQYVGCGMKFI